VPITQAVSLGLSVLKLAILAALYLVLSAWQWERSGRERPTRGIKAAAWRIGERIADLVGR